MEQYEDFPDLALAVRALRENGYTCVLCRGDCVYTETQRGVAPLLRLLDEGIDAGGFSAADKVVGKGAAFLYVLLGVRAIYADVISDGAKAVLEEHGIPCFYEKNPPFILNRAGTSTCPIEAAVEGISDPAEALRAIRKRLLELKKT